MSYHVEKTVMLQSLTITDVKVWEFVGTTPAHRSHYYNKGLDTAAYISNCGRKVGFYFNRKTKEGNFAICFSDNLVVELAL